MIYDPSPLSLCIVAKPASMK